MNGRAGTDPGRLIAQFNLLPSIELHPERQPDYAPAPVWAMLADGGFGHRHLSASILEVEELRGEWVTAFETRERRLALLGWRALERLVDLTGIALNADWIATRIDRDEVAMLRARLGRPYYGFAVGRARFLGLGAAWPAPPRGRDGVAWMRRAGRIYLEACVRHQPWAFQRRLELRLRRRGEKDWTAGDLPDPGRATALFRKLAPEVGPECVSLLS